jgi:hypothetical protein
MLGDTVIIVGRDAARGERAGDEIRRRATLARVATKAWCLETRAWDALTTGDYPQAISLSRHAQAVAPRGSRRTSRPQGAVVHRYHAGVGGRPGR